MSISALDDDFEESLALDEFPLSAAEKDFLPIDQSHLPPKTRAQDTEDGTPSVLLADLRQRQTHHDPHSVLRTDWRQRIKAEENRGNVHPDQVTASWNLEPQSVLMADWQAIQKDRGR